MRNLTIRANSSTPLPTPNSSTLNTFRSFQLKQFSSLVKNTKNHFSKKNYENSTYDFKPIDSNSKSSNLLLNSNWTTKHTPTIRFFSSETESTQNSTKENEIRPIYEFAQQLRNCCGKEGFDAACSMFEEFVTERRNIKPHPVLFATLISFCPDSERAIELFDTMQTQFDVNPTISVFNALMSTLTKHGDKRVFSLMQEMVENGVAPDLNSLKFFVSACKFIDASRLDQVNKLIERYEIPVDIQFSKLTLDAYFSSNQIKEGFNFFQMVVKQWNVKLDAEIFGIVLRNICERYPPVALDVLITMRKRKIKPNVTVYNSILKACWKMEDLPAAFETLTEMKHDNLEPNRQSYAYLILTCGGSKNGVEKALEIYNDLEKNSSPLINSVVVKNALLVVLSKNGDKRAFEHFNAMKKNKTKMNVGTFNAVLHACYTTGDTQRTGEILSELDKSTVRNTTTFNYLIDICQVEKDIEQALAYFNTMQAWGYRPTHKTIVSLLHVLGPAKDKRAKNIVEAVFKLGLPMTKQIRSLIKDYQIKL